MEYKASEWYLCAKENGRLTTWEDFLGQIKKRFEPSQYEDYVGKLSKLTQCSTITEYQDEFEALMNKVKGVPDPILLSMFIAGLKEEIQCRLLLSRPDTLEKAFSRSKMFVSHYGENSQDSRIGNKWQGRSNGRGTLLATGEE
ncbi:hypothetical protein C2S51_017975 [Perilla frutescens var. frutescens]|nr:hypothetical protein C2S51_017975 [Perilla frutescens var. frutescens]